MRPLVLFLAFRHIRRRPLQSGLTVLGVAVGVMVLVTALSLTNGFIDELIRSTLTATPHVRLSSLSGGTLDYDETLLSELANDDEVLAASPFLSGQVLIARRADQTRGISGRRGYTQVLGIDPQLEQNILDLEVLELLEDHETGIILGETLARSLGVFTGDEVMLAEMDRRPQAFEVIGTFRVNNELIDSVTSFTSLPALQDYLRHEGEVSGYHVRVNDPEQASDIGWRLAERSGLHANSWQNLFGMLIEQLNLQKALIGVVVFLIVIVAAMGIANILILTVAEKTEEIAILRAIGASQKQVLTVFTLEGLMLGGSGTLLGALLGLALSLYFRYQPYPLPGDLYFITRLPVELQAWDFIWVCGLSLATSIIAGVIPARRASGLDPASILR